MGHQREGGERDDLVEDEEGEDVGRESHTEGARDGDGETDVEPGLVRLVVATHVADGVDGGHDPQPRCDETEEHPEGFHLEGELEPGEDLPEIEAGPAAGLNRGEDDPADDGEERRSGEQGAGLAEIGPAMECDDQHHRDERPCDGEPDGGGRGHEPPPMSIRAAAEATPTLSEVQTPKTSVEPMRIQVGSSMLNGASVISSAPSGGALK